MYLTILIGKKGDLSLDYGITNVTFSNSPNFETLTEFLLCCLKFFLKNLIELDQTELDNLSI